MLMGEAYVVAMLQKTPEERKFLKGLELAGTAY